MTRRYQEGSPIPIRRKLVVGALALFSVAVMTRLVSLQIVSAETLKSRVEKQHHAVEKLTSRRGAIVDREGRPLAVSVTGATVGLRPSIIAPEDRERVANAVANATGISAGRLLRQLRQRERFFFATFQADRRAGPSRPAPAPAN